MTSKKALLLLAIIHLRTTSCVLSIDELAECEQIEFERKVIGESGILELDCLEILYESGYDQEYFYECFIFDGEGRLLHDYQDTPAHLNDGPFFRTQPIRSNVTFHFYVRIFEDESSQCFQSIVAVTIDYGVIASSCLDDHDKAMRRKDYYEYYHSCDREKLELQCPVVSGLVEYNISWFSDCNLIDKEHYHGNTLWLPTSLMNSHNYSCMISYGDYATYPAHFHVCYLANEPSNGVFIQPSAPTDSEIRRSVFLQCTGKASAGASVIVQWKYNGSDLVCSSDCSNRTEHRDNYLCSLDISIPVTSSLCGDDYICDYYDVIFNSTLLITNINSTQFGDYVCVIKTTHGEWSQPFPVQLIDSSDLDSPQILLKTTLALASGFTVLIAALVAFAYFKTDVLLFWKKHASSYETESRDYDVFLSYSVSKQNKNNIKEILHTLTTWFRVNNYSVFDQHRDNAGEFRYISTHELVSRCHRMMIILTPAYFESEWQLFDAHMGVVESIKGNTKLIFIVTPESNGHLKKMTATKHPGCSLLVMAMKQKHNSVILWNDNAEKKLETCFKKIELAMPKVPRRPIVHPLKTGCPPSFINDEHFGKYIGKQALSPIKKLVYV